MALPSLVRKLFENDGYGPHLKPSIVPFASSLASYGAEAATTQWVKDISHAPIYVDSSKPASGDGMSAASAVRSFSEALAIASGMPHDLIRIVVAGGTYSNDIISLYESNCSLELHGNVDFYGSITVKDYSVLRIDGSYNFSVNGNLDIGQTSVFLCISNFSIVYSSPTVPAIGIVDNAMAYFYSPASVRCDGFTSIVTTGSSSCFFISSLDLTSSHAAQAIGVDRNSHFYLSGITTVSCTSIANAIAVLSGSNFHINYYSPFTLTGAECGFYLSNSASAKFLSDVSLTVTSLGMNILDGSIVRTEKNITITLTGTNASGGVNLNANSTFTVEYSTTNTISVTANNNASFAFYVTNNSCMAFNSCMSVTGNYTDAVIVCIACSYTGLNPTPNYTNNATGRRYFVGWLAYISVGNSSAGKKRIPGTSTDEGYVDTATYGLYQ